MFEMSLELYIISGLLLSLTGAICTYLLGKRLLNKGFDDKFNDILDYLSTPEGQESVRNLGTIFAQGIGKGIGIGGTPLKGKTFGIPNTLLYEVWGEIKGKIGKKAISEETQVSSGGKFDKRAS